MINFKIVPATDFSLLKKFSCGISIMDSFLHETLEECVKNHYCTLFYVLEKTSEDLIAIFSLSFDSLVLDSDDKEELMSGISQASIPQITKKYKDLFLGKTSYPALEITYLAVSEKYRNKHIGKKLLQSIENAAKRQRLAGCQFLTVEAMTNKQYSAVSFYEKCQFTPCELPNPNKGTIRMYRTLYSDDI